MRFFLNLHLKNHLKNNFLYTETLFKWITNIIDLSFSRE